MSCLMHILQGCIPIVVSNPLGRLRKRYPMHALPDGQRHPYVNIRQVLATRFVSPFHVFLLSSLYDCLFFFTATWRQD